jgi:PAS domain S-box-containing protein
MFKDPSIKTKLFLPISILIVIFVVLTSSIIYSHYSKTKSLEALENRIILATHISKVLHETQKERGMSSGFLANDGKKFQKELLTQRESSNKRLNEVKKFLTIVNKKVKVSLQKALQSSQKLNQIRDSVDLLSISPEESINFYSSLNEDFLNVVIEISKTSKLPNITQNIIAYSDFLYAKENLGLIRGAGVSILSQNPSTEEAKTKFTNLVAIQKQYRKNFFNYASSDTIHFLANTFKIYSHINEIEKIGEVVLNSGSTQGSNIDPKEWFKHITLKINRLKIIDDYLKKEILSNIQKELHHTYTYFLLFALLNIVSIILFIMMIIALLTLLTREKRLKSIIDKYIISSTTDTKGIITFASEGFCRTSGYSEKELLGKPHSIVRHPDMPQSAFKTMWDTIQKGQSWDGRVKNRKKDGGYYWVYAYIEPLIDSKGNIEGYMGVRLNITESVILEEKIKDEIEKSRKKDQAIIQQSRLAQMGEMIAMIAHQWRQPLAAISATSASLELKADMNRLDNETVQQKAQDISRYSQHLSETIDDFRNFFKSDKKREETSYDDLIISVLKIIETSITYYNIQLIQELNYHDTFNTYANEVRQVILNLIKNAEDALIETQRKDPCIKISTYKENDKLILEVSDNAGGIPEDIIDKVFHPYFSTKTKKDGTGLGLYMSKTIIEEHCGGELSVSNGSDGAVFRIILGEKK